MPDEESGINRRDFLKSAGVVVTGSTLGTGLTLVTGANAAPQAAPAAPQKNVASWRLANPVTVKLKINGKENQVQIEPHWTLQRTLQFKLGLTGAKQMCDRGVCGSCTVIMNGRPILSCLTLACECNGATIETAEGIAKAKHPIIQAYINNNAFQCGYCTPGFVCTAKALLDKNPRPTEADVRDALGGNLCRCAAYPKIIESVLGAAAKG